MLGELQKSPVDPWTAMHVAVGVLAGGLKVPFLAYLGASVLYEFLEQHIEAQPTNFFAVSGPETGMNALTDVLVGIGGYAGGRKWLAGR